VPNDNNIAQRNVSLVAALSGSASIKEALANQAFTVANPNKGKSTMELRVNVPDAVGKLGLKVSADAEPRFVLASAERREVKLKVATKEFTAALLAKLKDRDITIELLADGIVIGGMTYSLDPKLGKK
jgi:hypothetical protein